MKKVIIFITYSFFFLFSFAGNHDPNNYFKDRSWKTKVDKVGFLHIQSEYRAEPVSKPNKLKIILNCTQSKKKLLVVENFKYCGIDAVSVIGGKVELMLADYSSAHPRGYCTIKRKKYLPLPKCK